MISYNMQCISPAMEMAIQAKGEMQPDEIPMYLSKYMTTFSKWASQRILMLQSYDMMIKLMDTFVPRITHNFPLTDEEDIELQCFLKENIAKGYVVPSMSPMASAFFFIKKKDGKLCPVQDYRYLNKHTICNAYPLPRIKELTDQLHSAQWFTKLDL